MHDADLAPELVDQPDGLIVAPWMQTVAVIEAKSMKRIITPGEAHVLALLDECHRFESMVVRPEPKTAAETSYDALMRWLGVDA